MKSKIEYNGFITMGITTIIMIVIFFPLNYLFLVPLSLGFASTWVYIIFAVSVAGVVSFLASSGDFYWGIIITVVLFILVIGYSISTSSIFTAAHRRSLIGEVKTKTFSAGISPIDINQIPIVDQDLATKLGDKVLGQQIGLGSQVELGEFTKQIVDNKLVWVAPLLHSGFFAWRSNSDGTPGYIIVSATNPDDVHLVQTAKGQQIKIKYQPNAFFNENLARRVFRNHKSIGLTDYSFEIDDSGKPYWVVTKFENTSGFGARNATGIILLDAQTGETKDYSLNNSPKWVDRFQPEDIVKTQLDDWGAYIHGYWNFANKDMLKTTDGSNIIYNKGVCYYYHGVTSVGKDESTVGFILTNSKTREATFYKVSGCIETAAMSSAEGKVQSSQYKADFPILLNIENTPTYFMCLKDKTGLIKLYAMVNVTDYSLVAVGQTLQETKENYVSLIQGKGNWTSLESSGNTFKMVGTISRIGQGDHDGKSFYYIILKEMPQTIFVVSLSLSDEIPLTRVNDKVQISYNRTEGKSIDAIGFDNLMFTQSKSVSQKEVEKSNQNVGNQKK